MLWKSGGWCGLVVPIRLPGYLEFLLQVSRTDCLLMTLSTIFAVSIFAGKHECNRSVLACCSEKSGLRRLWWCFFHAISMTVDGWESL